MKTQKEKTNFKFNVICFIVFIYLINITIDYFHDKKIQKINEDMTTQLNIEKDKQLNIFKDTLEKITVKEKL